MIKCVRISMEKETTTYLHFTFVYKWHFAFGKGFEHSPFDLILTVSHWLKEIIAFLTYKNKYTNKNLRSRAKDFSKRF